MENEMDEQGFKNNNWPKTLGELREMFSKYPDDTPIEDIRVDGCYWDYYEVNIKPRTKGVEIHISGGWD